MQTCFKGTKGIAKYLPKEGTFYLKFETKDFFSYLHGNSLKSIISTLEESDEITIEDLDELEKWIKNR